MKHSKSETTPIPSSRNSREAPLWARLTAGTLMVAGAFGLSSLGQEASAKPAKGDTTTATTPEKKINKMEKNPQVLIPNSDDMATNVRAWLTNFINYTNTGDEKFLQFYVVSTDSEVAQKLHADRQEVAGYQAQSHSKYHRYLPTGKKGVDIVENMTTFPNNGMTVTADVEVQVFLDNRAYEPYSTEDFRKQYTVAQFERPDPYHPGQTVEVWLPTYITDLGTPPIASKSKSGGLAPHGF